MKFKCGLVSQFFPTSKTTVHSNVFTVIRVLIPGVFLFRRHLPSTGNILWRPCWVILCSSYSSWGLYSNKYYSIFFKLHISLHHDFKFNVISLMGSHMHVLTEVIMCCLPVAGMLQVLRWEMVILENLLCFGHYSLIFVVRCCYTKPSNMIMQPNNKGIGPAAAESTGPIPLTAMLKLE